MVPESPPPTDVAAILAELDRRLRELEEELAAVGAAPPPAPEPEPAPGKAPAPEPATAAPDPGEAALEAIRAAVAHEVVLVAKAPDALVVRVDLAPPRDEGGTAGR